MKRLLAKLYRALKLPTNFQLGIMSVMQDKFLVGVTGVFFNAHNEVLLLKHTYRQVPWSLPGGYLKGGEHPQEGLEREIVEECGLIVSADRRMKIQTDRDASRLDISYLGTFIGGQFKPSHEVTEHAFFAFDHLPIIMKKQLILINQAVKVRSITPNTSPS